MSLFTYNGVTLPYCFTTNFSQEAVFDDSNTDWCYQRFDVSVNAILNTAYASTIDPSLAGADVATIMASVRRKLLRPRQKLSMSFNGQPLIPELQAGCTGTVDAKNGPQPQTCTCTLMTNTSFLVTYRIIAHYWESPVTSATSSNSKGNNIVYNRWSETVDIDERNYSTRTRDGKFVIRSDNADGDIADDLRSQFAVVGIPKGFKRKSSKYTVSPDGLAIMYNVVDQEVYLQPPDPAFVAEGEYIQSGTNWGAKRWGECRVTLKGQKTTKMADLINKAIAICVVKLASTGAAGIGNKTIAVMESASIRTNLYDNVCTVSMKAMLNTAMGRATNVGGVARNIVDEIAFPPLGSSLESDNPPAVTDRGTAGILLKAASYFDPSITPNVLDANTGQMQEGSDVGTAGKTPES